MASRRQERLGRYLDSTRSLQVGEEERELSLHGGASEREAFARRTNMGDRQSDALARQIAIATPIATAAALMLATDSPASSKSSAPASRTNQAFADEVDRQNAQKRSSERTSKYDGWYREQGKVDPGKSITLVLNPKTPIANPKLFIDDGGDRSNVKILSMLLGGKPILENKSAQDLYGTVLDGVTISSSNPLSATVQNISKISRTIGVYVVYMK